MGKKIVQVQRDVATIFSENISQGTIRKLAQDIETLASNDPESFKLMEDASLRIITKAEDRAVEKISDRYAKAIEQVMENKILADEYINRALISHELKVEDAIKISKSGFEQVRLENEKPTEIVSFQDLSPEIIKQLQQLKHGEPTTHTEGFKPGTTGTTQAEREDVSGK